MSEQELKKSLIEQLSSQGYELINIKDEGLLQYMFV